MRLAIKFHEGGVVCAPFAHALIESAAVKVRVRGAGGGPYRAGAESVAVVAVVGGRLQAGLALVVKEAAQRRTVAHGEGVVVARGGEGVVAPGARRGGGGGGGVVDAPRARIDAIVPPDPTREEGSCFVGGFGVHDGRAVGESGFHRKCALEDGFHDPGAVDFRFRDASAAIAAAAVAPVVPCGARNQTRARDREGVAPTVVVNSRTPVT